MLSSRPKLIARAADLILVPVGSTMFGAATGTMVLFCYNLFLATPNEVSQLCCDRWMFLARLGAIRIDCSQVAQCNTCRESHHFLDLTLAPILAVLA
jgi:hypothetical protein